MSRIALFFAAALLAGPGFAFAENPPAAASRPLPTRTEPPGPPPQPPVEEEIRSIHQQLEQQAKQLDVLAREIAQLTVQSATDKRALLDAVNRAVAAAGASASTGGSPSPAPSAEPAPAPSTAPEPEPAEAPKAEAVGNPGGGVKHTVAKGETLTSIAKEYNIPLADLKKANKIQDERRLQIGQILNIPPSKTPESSTEKKDKP